MNNIIVISGPSGSGKTTLIQMLLKAYPKLSFSVSHTTRAPRENEVHGVHYYFVTPDEFKQMIAEGAFIEWAMVHDHYYGTSLQEVVTRAQQIPFLVLDIDVQGAKIVKSKLPNALFILVSPPSMEALENRIRQREKMITPEFQKRMQTAIEELKQYPIYDYIIINDTLETAYRLLESIFLAYQNTTSRKQSQLEKIIQNEK